MSEEIISTEINKGLIIDEYKHGIRFGTDALFLAHFCTKGRRGCDLGSGSGVISFLLLSMGKASTMTGIEKNEMYCELSLKNAARNSLDEKYVCINTDVNDIKGKIEAGSMDMVVTNPPYLKKDCGFANTNELKYTAFHETTAGIDKFMHAAGYILKSGGRMFCVYRPEELSRLICAMEQNNIKLKRLRFVCPSVGKKPSLILAEGRKDGSDGAIIENNLYIYTDGTHTKYTNETEEIYNELA